MEEQIHIEVFIILGLIIYRSKLVAYDWLIRASFLNSGQNFFNPFGRDAKDGKTCFEIMIYRRVNIVYIICPPGMH